MFLLVMRNIGAGLHAYSDGAINHEYGGPLYGITTDRNKAYRYSKPNLDVVVTQSSILTLFTIEKE